jgi:hypothetical protein
MLRVSSSCPRLLLGAVLLCAAPALAQDAVAIVELATPPTMVGLGAQVSLAAATQAQAQKLKVLTSEDLRTRLDPKTYALLVKCGENPACVSTYLSPLGIKRAVVGSLGRDERNYVLNLALVDVVAGTVLADRSRNILIASRRFTKEIAELLPGLLRGEKEVRGTLALVTPVAKALVYLNGDLVGATPFKFTLKPGKYELKVEKKNYLPVTRLVTVEAGRTTEEEVRLLLMPGRQAEEETVPALAGQGGTPEPEARPIALSPATWIFGGLTLAAAGVGIGFGAASRSADRTLQEGYDAAANTYAGSRAQALAARQQALIANIGFGVAGAAAIATVVFVVLDVRAASSLEVTPTVGGGGAGLLLGGHF